MNEHAIQPSEPFVGDYEIVSGRTPDGKPYAGTMQFTRCGKFLHATADLGSLGERYGLALPFAGRLVMVFGPKDKVEIGAYTLVGDQLAGLWVPPGAVDDDFSKCGNELSRRTAAPNSFEIQQAHSIDGSAYTGKVTTEPASASDTTQPRPVRFTWNLHDGDYHSFGLAFADAIFTTFSFEPDKPYGVAVFELGKDGWHGTYLRNDSLDRGSMTVRRKGSR